MQSNKGNESRTYIGIDGGGTKTACLIGNNQGRILAMSTGGSTNLKSNPHEQIRDELERLIRLVVRDSGTTLHDVAGIFLGLAGSDREDDKRKIVGYLRAWLPADTRVVVDNDAVTALAAGNWGGPGVVLIAGTGSIAYGSDASAGYFARVGGWGYVMGDEGSGYDIGLKALKAVMRSYDGRSAPTELSAAVLKHLSLTHPQQIVPRIYENGPYRQTIADLSKLVISVSETGDEAARQIVDEAVRDLYELAETAGKRLAAKGGPVTLVLSGGLFSAASFEQAFRAYTESQTGNFKLQRLELPPAIGAWVLSMVESGVALTETLKAKIIREWQQRGGKAYESRA